ncbi:magnesium transport protein CorA [Geomonas silvestris]|uniref:Magnesium transport protein CorA n=1 Tax=Geomonas silvestris TaxID=2740184 RepID=A0A6V8MF09_9BACT|nr:magnesium/cobalt transporter CorA [Geomonas silvestris]GFO58454.1 magnesium transport protein CorA [Geomonas silvestris]
MSRLVKKRSKKIGLAPGTLVHLGTPRPGSTAVELIEYGADHLEQRKLDSLLQCSLPKPAPSVTWINVEGVSQVEVLQHFGECFKIHPLVLEDILATDQRPKAEDYGEYLYVVLKMLRLNEASGQLQAEQMSIVLGENFLISFQEGLEGDVFEPVRLRLKNDKGRLRQTGPDYLLHALLDLIVDNYFLILEKIAERMETLEDELIANPDEGTVQAIYQMKREMLFLHKAVWPLREVVGRLQRRESPLILEENIIYLRDLYDHTVQVVDTMETLRDMLSGMLDIYLTSVSNRLNQVMKVLTIIATIFMPLSFIVGLYGMNFKHMPELEWRYGYPAVLIFMAVVVAGMLYYFRKKRWF